MNTKTISYGNKRNATTEARQVTQNPITNYSKDTPNKKQDDKKFRTSRSSKSTRLNKSEINKLKKEMKKSFTTTE